MWAQSKISLSLAVMCLALGSSVTRTSAFSLLGPVQPWMQSSNGVIYPGDIGGPMELTNEYRWNVPVVTYGFDKSFLDFFGTNGVAAVESAIRILNDLPPASSMVLTNYWLISQQVNHSTQAQSLVDLKSQALSMLLEQLGMTQPTRNIYVIRDWFPDIFPNPSQASIGVAGMPIFYESDPYGIDWGTYWFGTPGNITNFIEGFNFDPETLEPSAYVNNIGYGGEFHPNVPLGNVWTAPYSFDPFSPIYTTVTEFAYSAGCFYNGLTRDDVGGLRYLISTNNVNYETLLPDIRGVGTNSFVNGAWRPGVDKITFVPHSIGLLPGTFLPMTNQFVDLYITNGITTHQQLQRVTTRPDFLFSAGNDTLRSGTTNWINNAILNNNLAGAGPGIIQPPVLISFQKAGSFFNNWSSYLPPVTWSEDLVQDYSVVWGSFSGSTNALISYPAPQNGNVSLLVRVMLRHANSDPNNFNSFEWSPTSQAGTVYALQTSTNLSTWNTLFAVTNNGSVCTYQNVNANSSSRFYRLTSQ